MKKIVITTKPNQLKSLFVLSKASILASLRNPSTLFFNFAFPFIFIGVFGVLGQGNVEFEIAIRPDSIKKGIVYEQLEKIDVFEFKNDLNNEQIEEQLKKGQTSVAINIQEQKSSDNVQTKYIINVDKSAADPQNADTVSQIIQNIVNNINNPASSEQNNIIQIVTNTVAGRKFTQIDFILPGQLSFALLSNALFGISFTLITLKKELIIKRIFASPAAKWTILASEGVSKVLIGFIQALLIIAVGYYAFDFTLANGIITVLYMLLLSFIGLIVFLGFGLFVSTLGKTEDAVSPIANIIMMPQLFLSGAFFPIELFPEFLQPIAKVLPMTFLSDALKKVAFEGVSILDTAPQIAGLFVWAVIVYLLVLRLFRWD